MRLVSPLLKHAVYPTLHHVGWLDRTMPPCGYAVVNYHGVLPADHSDVDAFLDGNLVSSTALRQQLQFLKRHYHIVDPEDFREWIEHGKPLPPRALLVTCDDGLLNTLTDMLSVLQSESVPCLFFVTAASCHDNPGMLWYEELYHLMRVKPLNGLDSQLPQEKGTDSLAAQNPQARWWSTVRRSSQLDAQARADWMGRVRNHCGMTRDFLSTMRSEGRGSERRWRLLSVDELTQLAGAGMSIGSHTLTHPVLSLCNEDEARHEIQASKTELERVLGRPVWAFAYPYGNPSAVAEREVRLVREAGFACAFLNVEQWDNERSGPFALPRTHVTAETTLPELAAHLSGLHNRLQRVVGG